ncbi:MAG: hypothetical protein HY521_00125 [Proteobacteria bacterium]|nr:hypothetical protein [Pseudomonadota bacterium]
MRLDPAGAARAIGERLAAPLGRDPVGAAWGVHDVVNETMAAAVRMHVTERGGDPTRATMVAFGGAGPVHVYNLAKKLRLTRVLVPLRPGVLSAVGLMIAPPAYDIVRTHKIALDKADSGAIERRLGEMTAEIEATLRKAEADGTLAFSYAVDIGYIGQGYQVAIPLDRPSRDAIDRAVLWERFATIYRGKYGYFYDDVPAEIVNLRASGRVLDGQLSLQRLAAAPAAADPRTGERPAYSALRRAMAPHAVYDRERLRPGDSFAGPAIVEEASATTVIDADGRFEVDPFGSLLVTLEAA